MSRRQISGSADFGIGYLARVAGTGVQTIRYYETQGLMPAPSRTQGNQRSYTQDDLNRLKFIRHARDLGFTLQDVRSLLQLAAHPEKPCTEADAIAKSHLQDVGRKIKRLKSLKRALTVMVTDCQQDKIHTCRIIETLANHEICTIKHGAGES